MNDPWAAQRWARNQKCRSAAEKFLLVMLAVRSSGNDNEWSCYPSQQTLADDCQMGVRTVRRHLASLEADGFIRRAKRYREDGTRSSDLIFLTVTLPADLAASTEGLPANYDRTTGQTMQGLPATGGRAEVPDELPEEVPDILSDSFDSFWSVYPRKEAKGNARKAWLKVPPGTSIPAVIAGATRYRDDPNREPEFTKHPATWLNAGCWEDDPLPSRTNSNDKRTHQPIEEWWDRSEPSGELEL